MYKIMNTSKFSKDILEFASSLLKDFGKNQGYLLSGALAFYILLSLIPFLILTVIILANIIDEASLLEIISHQLSGLFPAAMDSFVSQVQRAYSSRTLFGYFGTISIIIFSSLIFRTLQKIMKIIFPRSRTRRLRLRSIVIPYLYMLVFLLISFVFSVLSTTIETINQTDWSIFSITLDISPLVGNLTQILILLTNFSLLVLFYKIFPQVKIKWKHAIYAGFFVGLIWMTAKQILLYFFQHFSSVGIIYGTLSSFFILLISLEIFSLVLLFGAQFIATYQQHKQKRQTQY